MVLRRLASPADVARTHHAVVVVELDELDAGVQRRRAVLVGDHVLTAPRHDGGPRRRQDAHGDLVGHDAGGHEQGGGLAHPVRERLLERADGGILAVVVVTDDRIGHRAPHRGRRLGDGVAAKVDDVGHDRQVIGAPLTCGG